MRLPIGFDVKDDPSGAYVLRFKKNLYGLKQAAKNWFDMLSDGLIARDFVSSTTDPCVYYRHNAIILVYTDDCIIFAKEQQTIDDIIKSLHDGPENYDFTNDGDLKQYLGVDIIRKLPGEFELR